jgi:hypothetical protein
VVELHWIERKEDPKAILKLVEKRKIIPSGIDPQPSSRIQSIEM